MSFQSNPQLELAFQYVRFTNKNIFLTGRAGTGKTTFLHQIKKDTSKRLIVVAPTGVAAINAGGVTIHSFFQLPFGPIVPGQTQDLERQRRFSGDKIRLIRSLDLLVIDEISMVRADLLDGIDGVLRRYRNPFQAFGGVQLLMIGDLHQLPPVVKEDEWQLLRDHYPTAYFFGSIALRETVPVTIELTHIFRQSDLTFIELLNRVRDNRIDAEVLEKLNSRFIQNFQPTDEEGYITLSSHNASANEINVRRLASLTAKPRFFEAEIEGDFPEYAYPTDAKLELKLGSQVMFVKNDVSRDKIYFNGKIGKITRFDGETIYVKCPADYAEIPVSKVEWLNQKYNLNAAKEVEEEVIGKFAQHPLKLAWAITIHKSQGLTFERAIIDANAAFAHGQVYVALSRCKTFEGLVLSSRIGGSSIRTDSVVKNYSAEAVRKQPDEQHLQQSKSEFQRQLLTELFDFSEMKKLFERAVRAVSENENALQPGLLRKLQEVRVAAEDPIFDVADKFRSPLAGYFQQPILPEENQELQARVGKGGSYFSEKVKTICLAPLQAVKPETDNKEVKKKVVEALENLVREAFVKNACFEQAVREGFATNVYLRLKADAALDFQLKKVAPSAPAIGQSPVKVFPKTAQSEAPEVETFSEIQHPELVNRLRTWRTELAAELETPAYVILHNKTLYVLAASLPQDLAELAQLKGVGKAKVEKFGAAILEIISQYCGEMGIERGAFLPLEFKDLTLEKVEGEAGKKDTKRSSLLEFQAGKTVEEIAEERLLTVSTIEGHLAHFIGTGELDISAVMPDGKVQALLAFFRENPAIPFGEAKAFFGEEFSYGELRMAHNHWERTKD